MTHDEITSKNEPLKVRLRITPRDGESIECSIPAVRWAIVQRGSSRLLYCPSCNELVKENNCRPPSEIEQYPDRSSLCAHCHEWMVIVDFIQRLDVSLPQRKNSQEMWTPLRHRPSVT